MLYIHPTHLSNTIKITTGKSPCDICNEKTIYAARALLAKSSLSIAAIAIRLTFEPPNFTKYFKKHAGADAFGLPAAKKGNNPLKF